MAYSYVYPPTKNRYRTIKHYEIGDLVGSGVTSFDVGSHVDVFGIKFHTFKEFQKYVWLVRGIVINE
jgi:hypothetical protein